MKTWNFWKQILLMLLTVVLLVTLILLSLRFFTHHGQEIKVGDIRGMYMDELKPYEEQFGFRFVVRDSVYNPDVQPGKIISQSPQPGACVKRNRTFYVVLAASLPASVQMPDLKDLSLRQAEALLETYGLKVGEKTIVPSIVKGAVVEQLFQGEKIEPGTLIRRGSSIDLQLGDGKGSLPVVQQDSLMQEDTEVLDGEYEIDGEEPDYLTE